MKKLSLLVPFLILILTGCHPDGPINNYSNTNQVNYTPNLFTPIIVQILPVIPLPAGANGALYTINSIFVGGSNPGFLPTGGYACAWFGSDSSTKNAGLILAAGDTLVRTDSFENIPFTLPVYLSAYRTNLTPPIFASNSIAWNVQGDSSEGVAPLISTDITPFPVVNLNVPKTFSVAGGLTMHYTVSGAYDAKFYTISLNNGTPLIYSGGSDTSASFSTNQLYPLFPTKGQLISVSVILAKFTPFTIGSQRYYFVKTSIYAASTRVQ
jgi:hypothetical protein